MSKPDPVFNPKQMALDWDAEFDKSEMTEDELAEWTVRYVILKPELFPEPLDDFAANREALRKVAMEKFPLVLQQTFMGPRPAGA